VFGSERLAACTGSEHGASACIWRSAARVGAVYCVDAASASGVDGADR
jgi:hypothetical protein